MYTGVRVFIGLKLFRQNASCELVFPFVEQRPVNGTGAEVCHMLIPVESIDGRLEELPIISKRGTMARQKPFDAAVLDSLQ